MIAHMLLSLVLAGVAVAILVEGLRCRPNTPVWGLFAILFFGIWAGGVWVAPAGPMHLGVYWLPFLLTGMSRSLLILGGSWVASFRRLASSIPLLSWC
jgi:hypothetical protein